MNICRTECSTYIETHLAELHDLVKTLCQIPAPSGLERARAEFCCQWLERHGVKGVCLDAADNAILALNAYGQQKLTVFTAHTDTVFSDTTPFLPEEESGILRCPGVYDDTANLAVLLMAARFLAEHDVQPADGMLIVADSGEEGLGNLRGCRRLLKDYQGRIARLISFDLTYDQICAQAVGSSRYRVTVGGEGGHSFFDFGCQSAIDGLAQLISALYAVPIPQDSNGSKTTYNVGIIEGGTSINTIAQQASMLYEYRSDSVSCLVEMERSFHAVLTEARNRGWKVNAELLGTRPCANNLDADCQRALIETCSQIIDTHTGSVPAVVSGSTDCNIPLSMGIPAVSFGLCSGKGAHTRKEQLETASLKTGLGIALDVMLHFC
ncbi:Acetylornithine deacetylase/Succinyl-diaminopimelate desuccinylase [Oscillibacter sp. PC13]|uniref:M20/M25/M40 family metallo-hydrolase n=1 Tax=Oscillibacter sp. PC13 TaxID=1855299 RepID=UPI0008DED0A6|nr:M20/M25/M40 family metallo-hydrolase [Oscillibacter sp. PC13]SFP36071.1 Acetylornithine deacetylase/Succinyl-diaminopimelate desuccinylase [Oscillibacter sp. PC13]